MSEANDRPAPRNLDVAATNPGGAGHVLVPVPDVATFMVLAHGAMKLAADSGDRRELVLVDPQTAGLLAQKGGIDAWSGQVCVLGELPEGEPTSAHVTVFRCKRPIEDTSRFFVLLSPAGSVACCGSVVEKTEFDGGWSTHPEHVLEVAEALLAGVEDGDRPELPVLDARAAEHALDWANRLAGMVVEQMTRSENALAVDKNDLMSVLDILKVISSKRRSHDVLFVFVDEIARIVKMSRCSVVRIWGDESVAHVLASHDDQRVADLRLDLAKYPEIQRAYNTLGRVSIDDTTTDRVTAPVAEDLRQAGISSIMVIPIVLLDPSIGSLFLRAARSDRPFTEREISFCEIVAEAASNALERAHLFESIQRANERLELLAITDGLTGLFNHRHFRERIDEEFVRATRYGLDLSCVIFDIDDFKKINDTFGHLNGDHVLQEIGARTLTFIRQTDVAARYGGEEFAIIMPQTGSEGALAQSERLLDELRLTPYKGMPSSHRVTVSIGVGVFDKETMSDCEALIRAADSALYQAKRNGKNQAVMANPKGPPP